MGMTTEQLTLLTNIVCEKFNPSDFHNVSEDFDELCLFLAGPEAEAVLAKFNATILDEEYDAVTVRGTLLMVESLQVFLGDRHTWYVFKNPNLDSYVFDIKNLILP
jgi:hypothetical protein